MNERCYNGSLKEGSIRTKFRQQHRSNRWFNFLSISGDFYLQIPIPRIPNTPDSTERERVSTKHYQIFSASYLPGNPLNLKRQTPICKTLVGLIFPGISNFPESRFAKVILDYFPSWCGICFVRYRCREIVQLGRRGLRKRFNCRRVTLGTICF